MIDGEGKLNSIQEDWEIEAERNAVGERESLCVCDREEREREGRGKVKKKKIINFFVGCKVA